MITIECTWCDADLALESLDEDEPFDHTAPSTTIVAPFV